MPDTVYGPATTETRLQSATADDLAWARYTSTAPSEPRTPAIEAALERVTFTELVSPQPLHAAVSHVAEMLAGADERAKSRLYVVTGRARRLAAENQGPELQKLVDEHNASTAAAEVRKTVGDVATAFVAARTQVGLLILQAPLISNDH
jgi:hypothetical protein